MPHATGDLLEDFERDGYVVIPSKFSAEELEELRTACKAATDLARAGKWPHVRTVPRQFPPWPQDASDGIWGVQQLLNPDLPGHAFFTKIYFSEKTVSVVRELLECSDDELVMELSNMLVRPDKDFELRWHRDDIPATATPEEEMERLGKPSYHAQWNIALYEDSSLILVPESHKRPRTDFERNADPYEPNMPSQLALKLEPGEMVFYNNNIFHRGAYDSTVERMTLHGTMGHVDGGPLRARNVLQHGRDWIDKIDLSQVEDVKRAEGMRDRLVALASKHQVTGFSHDD